MAAGLGTAAQYRLDPPGRARRAATLALVIALHLLIAWLLVNAKPSVQGTQATTTFNLFDVPAPPPVDMPTPPPPPTLEVRPPPGGGSSGRAPRPDPAPRAAGIAGSIDATLVPEAPPSTTELIDLGMVASGDGEGGGGTGSAEGSGTGRGDGVGGGTGGSGSIGRWAAVDWIEQPRVDQWRAVWPDRALRQNQGGVAILVCIVPRPGRPRSCFVAAEHPAGRGFGGAALALSKLDTFRIRPVRTPEGRWSRIPIRVPVIFVAKDRAAKPISATAEPPARPRP